MTDVFDRIVGQWAEQFPEQFNDPLLLVTGGVSLDRAMGWLQECYSGDGKVPYASVPTAGGQALFFMLDGRRMTATELIAKLNGLGIAVELKKAGRFDAVYVVPQRIAGPRARQWN